jgi:Domain of unknown function (DUF4157)/L,D-transpeptidase catalytic domain
MKSNAQRAHSTESSGLPRPAPLLLQRKCSCGQHTIGGECETCRRKQTTIQRHSTGTSFAPSLPPVVTDVLHSSGRSLDVGTRSFLEPHFGRDFSQVRVHTDAQAAESARSVSADAYTVGNHVVFGAGLFQPNQPQGVRLLAHELTHVVQQNAGAVQDYGTSTTIDPSPHLEAEAQRAAEATGGRSAAGAVTPGTRWLQRQPKGTGSGTTTATPHITEVRVNQTTPQRVKATLSDGSTFEDECSTGKGHCCFDETSGTAEGGACSPARSRQTDNNCTPIGTFTVTTKLPKTPGGVELWTQFHDAKQVALHQYSPVDGTPLSHGCVRMHKPTAQKIFDGARERVTKVVVEGDARPKCKHPALQSEWNGDFLTAGSKPPDGRVVDPFLGRRPTALEIARERHEIAETRQALKSALGVGEKDLDVELASRQAGAPIVSKIPRCVPTLTVEEQKVPKAKSSGSVDPAAAATATSLTAALNRTGSSAGAERVVRKFGEDLWKTSTAAARAGGSGSDDRQIYWTRLMLANAIRQWDPMWPGTSADTMRRLHSRLLLLLEQTSRGMTTAKFPTTPDTKRILISGFDPFGFPSGGDIRQSNLSGAAALAVDGETLTRGAISARIESVVYPVRYADFNEGMVENFLRPHLTGAQPPNLVMSISQGGSQFELEEWAGRRRSTNVFQENLGQISGGSPASPTEPPGIGAGPEFLQTNVPSAMLGSMRGSLGRKTGTKAIPEETSVTYLPAGGTKPQTAASGPPTGAAKSVEGSGGGFLSNEIFYRNSLLRTTIGSQVPMIHLHTPALAPGSSDAMRNNLIATIKNLLQASLPFL